MEEQLQLAHKTDRTDAIVIFGLVITYAEFIPILISVRDLFR